MAAPKNGHEGCAATEGRQETCNWLKRVRSAAVVRFFERHVVELEKRLHMGISTDSSKIIGSPCIRAGSGTEEVVLCFRIGGWWPVVTGLIAGDA